MEGDPSHIVFLVGILLHAIFIFNFIFFFILGVESFKVDVALELVGGVDEGANMPRRSTSHAPLLRLPLAWQWSSIEAAGVCASNSTPERLLVATIGSAAVRWAAIAARRINGDAVTALAATSGICCEGQREDGWLLLLALESRLDGVAPREHFDAAH